MHAHIHARINAIQRGEVPQGYRKTNAGIIPIDWKIFNLKDICRGKGVYGINASATNYSISLPRYLRITDIDDFGFVSDNDIKSVNHSESKNFLLKENDLLFARTGSSTGKTYLYSKSDGELVFAGFLIKFSIDETKASSYFIKKFTETQNYWNWVKMMSVRSGQPGINSEEYSSLKIPLPPLPEQCKIAEILSAWDDAIRLQHELIEQKKVQKRGLMQLLLTGAIRVTEMGKLSPEAVKKRVAAINQDHVPESYQKIQWAIIPDAWNFLKIKDVAQQVVEFNSDNTVQKVLSCTKHDGLVDSLSYFKRQVFSEDLSKYKIVRRGNFAYATNHIEEGSIGLQNIYEAGLVSPMYTVFKTQPSMLAEFLYAVLKTETYRKIFEVQTSASINRRGSLRWNQFSQIRVPVPSAEEQSKIVDILTTADKEIELLEAELEHLRAQKTGLMQLLLTGAIRVHEGAGHNSGFEEKTD